MVWDPERKRPLYCGANMGAASDQQMSGSSISTLVLGDALRTRFAACTTGRSKDSVRSVQGRHSSSPNEAAQSCYRATWWGWLIDPEQRSMYYGTQGYQPKKCAKQLGGDPRSFTRAAALVHHAEHRRMESCTRSQAVSGHDFTAACSNYPGGCGCIWHANNWQSKGHG